jgi:hypothetical protein
MTIPRLYPRFDGTHVHLPQHNFDPRDEFDAAGSDSGRQFGPPSHPNERAALWNMDESQPNGSRNIWKHHE